MKKTNKIISLMLSTQLVATSVSAGPASLQKQPNSIGGVTAPLYNKGKKSVDGKSIAMKAVSFSSKALWWFIKQHLMVGVINLLDMGIFAFIGVVKITINYKRVPSEENCRVLCEDMCCCLQKLGKSLDALSGLTISPEIEQEYQCLTDKFEIVEKFLSHYKISEYKCYGILEQPVPTGAGNKMYYKEEFEMHRDNKSFNHAGHGLRTIVEKFYKKCSISIASDKNLDSNDRATEVQQKLNAWKDTMYTILDQNNLKNFSACDIMETHDWNDLRRNGRLQLMNNKKYL